MIFGLGLGSVSCSVSVWKEQVAILILPALAP